ncbi:MAG: hypothetical protein J7M05_12580, partial [Anaerolineae bacterium]|nr:hypothetical protein [Anaerolineae bacterium]
MKVLAGWAKVYLAPEDVQIVAGNEFELQVRIDQAENLYGVDLRLRFSPQVLEVVDVDSTQEGVQAQPGEMPFPDFVVRNEANNVSGTLWYAATQLNPREPMSGAGLMLTVHFRAKEPGVSPVELEYVQLVSRDGLELPLQVVGGSQVLVEPSNASPTPTRTPKPWHPTPTRTPRPTRAPRPTFTPQGQETLPPPPTATVTGPAQAPTRTPRPTFTKPPTVQPTRPEGGGAYPAPSATVTTLPSPSSTASAMPSPSVVPSAT